MPASSNSKKKIINEFCLGYLFRGKLEPQVGSLVLPRQGSVILDPVKNLSVDTVIVVWYYPNFGVVLSVEKDGSKPTKDFWLMIATLNGNGYCLSSEVKVVTNSF